MSIQEVGHLDTRTLNGIDVDALEATVAALQQLPELGKFQFRLRNDWIGVSANRSYIQGLYGNGAEDDSRTEPFVVTCDEPPVLFGDNGAPNPVEFLLHALAACVTTTLVQEGAGIGVVFEAIESKLEADIDLRGAMGLADDVPKGLAVIRVIVRARTAATPDTLLDLARKSPVYNTLKGGVPIEFRFEPY